MNHVLGPCTVSKNHQLRMMNYQYSLVFTNFTALLLCICRGVIGIIHSI